MSIVKINTIDKITISNILPQVDSILVQIISRDISRKIEISDKDRETINLKPALEGGVTWNKDNIEKTEVEIEFTNSEIHMIQEQISKLDKSKNIKLYQLDTVLKFQDVKNQDEKKDDKKANS